MIFALALCLKALVPSGYMLGTHGQSLVLEICADQNSDTFASTASMPVTDMTGAAPMDMAMDAGSAHSGPLMPASAPGHHDGSHGADGKDPHSKNPHKGIGACPYSILAVAPLPASAADIAAVLLFLFAVAVATIGRQVRLNPSPFLRPPLRGPPASA